MLENRRHVRRDEEEAKLLLLLPYWISHHDGRRRCCSKHDRLMNLGRDKLFSNYKVRPVKYTLLSLSILAALIPSSGVVRMKCNAWLKARPDLQSRFSLPMLRSIAHDDPLGRTGSIRSHDNAHRHALNSAAAAVVRNFVLEFSPSSRLLPFRRNHQTTRYASKDSLLMQQKTWHAVPQSN